MTAPIRSMPETIGDLSAIEEVATQNDIRVNERTTSRRGWGIGPGIERSSGHQVPQPKPRIKPTKAQPPVAPVQAPPPARGAAPIRSMPELVDAIRARRDELNISHETIDNIAGLQSGYTSKLLGPIQLKGFSHMSLGAVLGALGIGLVVIEDPEARAKVEGRWQKRKRPQRLAPLSIPLSMPNEVPAKIQVTPELQRQLRDSEYMREIGKRGGKRRLKTMGKRARQRVASHAARIRWAKRVASHA